MKTGIIAISLIVVGYCTSSKPALALPWDAAGQVDDGKSLPDIFVSVLADVRAATSIPVLLPTELPRRFSDAKHARVQKVRAGEYAVALYYELGVGDSGFAAFFAARNNAQYSPRELGNVSEVKLADGIVGFFRPVSCGGSCAPANLWWEQGGALYQNSTEAVFYSPRKEAAKDHNGGCQLGYLGRPSVRYRGESPMVLFVVKGHFSKNARSGAPPFAADLGEPRYNACPGMSAT